VVEQGNHGGVALGVYIGVGLAGNCLILKLARRHGENWRASTADLAIEVAIRVSAEKFC
jgi:hypothetical protein